MITLTKTKQIEASHQLPHHDGKCRGLHGHTWEITLKVQGGMIETLGPKRGMLFDYFELGKIMKKHVESLDHRHLNDIFDNPTSENIALAIFNAAAPEVWAASGEMAKLASVVVSETRNTSCEVTG